MSKHEIVVTVASQPRIEKLLARLERAHEMRGLDFSYDFTGQWTRKRRVGPKAFIHETVQTLEVNMEELSDDWQLLFKTEPVDINAETLDGSPAIRKWNPMISSEDHAIESTHGDFEDRCDHCTSGRRGRHRTYTLQRRDDPSITKTVGSSCLYEYTAIDPADVEALLRLKGYAETGYAGPRNRRKHPSMDLGDFALLAGVWAYNGLHYQKGLGSMFFNQVIFAKYRGRGKHDLGHYRSVDQKFVAVIKGVEGLNGEGGLLDGDVEFDLAVATHANNYMLYMRELAGLNSFEQNVRNIAKAGVVTSKTANLAGGAVSGYLRENKKRAQEHLRKAQERKQSNSKWVGEVGKRQSFGECTVAFTRRLENQWGSTTLTRFTDSEDNILVWFRSGDHDDLQVGMKVNLVATVKKHDSYKEAQQTTITRGRIE